MLWKTIVACVGAALATASTHAADITIHITGPGGTAKYIKEGDATQMDVTIKVDQSVKWINDGNKTHTATSTLKDSSGARIFDTGNLASGASKEISFTRALYMNAGGVAGGKLELEYFCQIHGITNMKSKLIIDDTSNTAQDRPPTLVPRAVTLGLTVSDDGKSLTIDATGEVPTKGYTAPRLVQAAYLTVPDDGIQDVYLLAVPPSSGQDAIVSQVDVSTNWKEFKNLTPWIKGVRLHGVGSSVVEKLLP